MKRLLCSQTTGDEVMICRTYYATSAHRQTTWDGRAPLDVDLRSIVQRATEYAQGRLGLVGPVRTVRLEGLPDVNGERYYYFTVEVEGPDPTDWSQVILDLDGKVIEPEIRKFEDSDEYYRYLDSLHE